MDMKWPIKSTQPFTIQNDYSWNEIGAILRLIDVYRIGLVIETGVHAGDFAAWMMAKCFFDPEFHYTGIALELECVHTSIRERIPQTPQAFIIPGLSYSDAILNKISKYIKNSFRPVLVFCNGCDKSKEFSAYLKILRPGDILVVSGFPVSFSLGKLQDYIKSDKIIRVVEPYLANTRLVAGVVQ